jgi:hypothetical protein
LEKQFIRFNDPQTLDGAIRAWGSALSVLERHGALRPVALINQANCLSRRYEAGSSEQDINRTIHNARAALRLAPESQCPAIQNDLSGMYLSRFEREDDLEDLNEALRHAEAAVERTTNEDSTLVIRGLTLSNCRSALFETDGDINHIKRAILDLRRAERYARRTGTDVLPRTLSRLAQCLWILHSETQHPTHLELTVNRAQEALQVSVEHGGAALHRAIVRDFANFLSTREKYRRDLRRQFCRARFPPRQADSCPDQNSQVAGRYTTILHASARANCPMVDWGEGRFPENRIESVLEMLKWTSMNLLIPHYPIGGDDTVKL